MHGYSCLLGPDSVDWLASLEACAFLPSGQASGRFGCVSRSGGVTGVWLKKPVCFCRWQLRMVGLVLHLWVPRPPVPASCIPGRSLIARFPFPLHSPRARLSQEIQGNLISVASHLRAIACCGLADPNKTPSASKDCELVVASSQDSCYLSNVGFTWLYSHPRW